MSPLRFVLPLFSLLNFHHLAGRRTFLPGAFTGSLACLSLQIIFNELHVIRLKRILQRNVQPSSPQSNKIPWWGNFLKMFGLERMSTDDYLVKLRNQREGLLAKMEELERQIEEERKTRGSEGVSEGKRKSESPEDNSVT